MFSFTVLTAVLMSLPANSIICHFYWLIFLLVMGHIFLASLVTFNWMWDTVILQCWISSAVIFISSVKLCYPSYFSVTPIQRCGPSTISTGHSVSNVGSPLRQVGTLTPPHSGNQRAHSFLVTLSPTSWSLTPGMCVVSKDSRGPWGDS